MTHAGNKQEAKERSATTWLPTAVKLIERLTILALYASLVLLFASKLIFRDRESVSDRLDQLLNPTFSVFLLLGSFTGAAKSIKEYRSRPDKRPSAAVDCLVWLGAYVLAFAFGCYLMFKGGVLW